MSYTTEEKIKIVEGAINRLESGWMSCDLANDKYGKSVHPKSGSASCWCAYGALAAEVKEDGSVYDLAEVDVIRELAFSIPDSYKKVHGDNPYARIYRLNDRYGKDAVIKTFNEYIEKLKEQK